MRAAWLALAACAGCNSILGLGDVHLAPGDGPSPDGPSPDVTGISMITWYKTDGTSVTTPEDLTGYTIGVYALNGSAHIAGSGGSDGTFTIPGVPQGPYLLELTRPSSYPELYVSSQRSVDASWQTLGRPDAVSTTMPTMVALDITGMTAWTDADQLWADSYAIGTEAELYDEGAGSSVEYNVRSGSGGSDVYDPSPGAGATTLRALLDWHSGYTYDASGAAPRLVQNTAGDDFYVEHLTSATTYDPEGYATSIATISDVLATTSVDMTDGGSANVSASFAAVAPTHAQSLSINLIQYRTAMADAGHYLDRDQYGCDRLANYAADHDGSIGSPPWEIRGAPSPTQSTVSVTNSPYGDPFPTAWPALFTCSFFHYRLWTTAGSATVFAQSFVGEDLPGSDSMSFDQPTVTTPTNIVIGGKPFLDGGTIAFDGTSPVTMTWAAQSIVGKYELLIKQVDPTTGKMTTAATISTADTSVAIPASLLTEGAFYHFTLYALYQTDETAFGSGSLRLSTFPNHYAYLASGIFRFSADCGDGMVGSDEQCDGSGADTATCDSDCTFAVCGDGYVNSAAGEQCDNVSDSVTCDGDCTLPMCGDGYVNLAAGEACDDGNTGSGDGCSANCQVETGYTCSGQPSVCTPG